MAVPIAPSSTRMRSAQRLPAARRMRCSVDALIASLPVKRKTRNGELRLSRACVSRVSDSKPAAREARPRAPPASKPRCRWPSRSRTQRSWCGISSSTTTLPPGLEDARRLAEHRRRLLHVVQALRERPPGPVLPDGQREVVQVLAEEGDVPQALAPRPRAGLRERRAVLVDGHHPPRPARDGDAEHAGAAAEVGHVQRRQQRGQRARPEEPGLAGLEQPLVERLAVLALAEQVLEPRQVAGRRPRLAQASWISGQPRVLPRPPPASSR